MRTSAPVATSASACSREVTWAKSGLADAGPGTPTKIAASSSGKSDVRR